MHHRSFAHWLTLSFAILCVLPPSAFACYWDRDTLRMERRDFPSIHELIVGHFVRHSPAYYEWRVRQGEAISPSQRTPNEYDDLAVALDKLGRHDEAIASIRQKLERFPNEGRYESEANLGTFLIHAGKWEEGLVHIKRAIEINPDAHFGREIYQQRLVEYLLHRREWEAKAEANPELADRYDPEHPRYDSFAEFVLSRLEPGGNFDAELNRAVQGVAGMIRFGNHDSPVLMTALGDLLSHHNTGAKQLAARAYLRAGDEAKAEGALEMQVGADLNALRSDLEAEVRAGEKLSDRIAEAERNAIDNGTDPDIMFDLDDERLILSESAPLKEPKLPHGELDGVLRSWFMGFVRDGVMWTALILIPILLLIGLGLCLFALRFAWRWLRHSRSD